MSTTYVPKPAVQCSYCGYDSCRHPSRLGKAEYVEWLLDLLGRDVLHVYARQVGDRLVYDCPVCGQEHGHGNAYGSRATHCPVGVPMTVILHPEEGQ